MEILKNKIKKFCIDKKDGFLATLAACSREQESCKDTG